MTLEEELINSLFLVRMSSNDPPTTVNKLIVALPLSVKRKFVVFNAFYLEFDLAYPTNFSQIVIVLTWGGT